MVLQGLDKLESEKKGRDYTIIFHSILVYLSFPGAYATPVLIQGDEHTSSCHIMFPYLMAVSWENHALSGGLYLPHIVRRTEDLQHWTGYM